MYNVCTFICVKHVARKFKREIIKTSQRFKNRISKMCAAIFQGTELFRQVNT